MVKLRLTRMGKCKQPFYRIVAMNVTTARNGRALAQLGTYDPLHSSIKINEDSAIEWLNNGAQMTETVQALFSAQGILARWKGKEGTVREDVSPLHIPHSNLRAPSFTCMLESWSELSV